MLLFSFSLHLQAWILQFDPPDDLMVSNSFFTSTFQLIFVSSCLIGYLLAGIPTQGCSKSSRGMRSRKGIPFPHSQRDANYTLSGGMNLIAMLPRSMEYCLVNNFYRRFEFHISLCFQAANIFLRSPAFKVNRKVQAQLVISCLLM